MSLEKEIKGAFKEFIANHKKEAKKYPSHLVVSSGHFVFRYPFQTAIKDQDKFIQVILTLLMSAGIKTGDAINMNFERSMRPKDNAFFQSGKRIAKGILPEATPMAEPDHHPFDVYTATVAARHVSLDGDDELLYSSISAEPEDEPQDQAISSMYVTLAQIQTKKQSDSDLKSEALYMKNVTTEPAPTAPSPFSRKKNLGFYGHTTHDPKLSPRQDTRPYSAPIIKSETEQIEHFSTK